MSAIFMAHNEDEVAREYKALRNKVKEAFPDAYPMPTAWNDLAQVVFESLCIYKSLGKFVGPIYDPPNGRVEVHHPDNLSPEELKKIDPDVAVAAISIAILRTYIAPDDLASYTAPNHDRSVIKSLRDLIINIAYQSLQQMDQADPSGVKYSNTHYTESSAAGKPSRKPSDGWQMEDLS